MRCPVCKSEEVCAAECYEIVYELGPDGDPRDLIDAADLLAEPCGEQFYYLCEECDCRWRLDGATLGPPTAIPPRIPHRTGE